MQDSVERSKDGGRIGYLLFHEQETVQEVRYEESRACLQQDAWIVYRPIRAYYAHLASRGHGIRQLFRMRGSGGGVFGYFSFQFRV